MRESQDGLGGEIEEEVDSRAKERQIGSGVCPKTDTSQTANPKEHYSISLQSFCFKVKSVTKEQNHSSNSSRHSSVPIYGPNPSSERQAQKERHTHTHTLEDKNNYFKAFLQTHTLTHTSASTLIL